MSRTLLAVSSLILGIGYSSVALAQVPGDYNEGYGAPGMVQPQPVLVVQNPCNRVDVMANRWAIGLGFGSLSTQHKGSDDQTEYGVGELSLRFRATPHFELELAAGGGTANQDDYRLVRTVALNVRYRFAAYSHWNWWLMGGIGAVTMGTTDDSDDQLDAKQRPLIQGGVGLEHRWNRFAIQAELKFGALGEAKGSDVTKAMPEADGSIGRDAGSDNDTYGVGSFTIGAGYYF